MVRRSTLGIVVAPILSVGLALNLALALPRPAHAEDPNEGRHRLTYDALFGARYNAIGAVAQARFGYQLRLYNASAAALADNYIAIRVATRLSPAWLMQGAHLELQPLTLVRLQVGYTGYGSFGVLDNFTTFTTFASAQDDWSDEARENLPDRKLIGGFAHVSAGLRAALGPVAGQVWSTLRRYHVDLPGSDNVFYDQSVDLAVPGRGFAHQSHADVVVRAAKWLRIGARYSLAHGFADTTVQTQRLGPSLIFEFRDKPKRSFHRPQLILLTQWWLEHPHRTGGTAAKATPNVSLGFGFGGDLWRSGAR